MIARRGLLLLGVAAAVMTAAIVALLPPEPPPVATAGGLVFPNLAGKLADVRRIVLTRGAESLVLERQGDRFVLPARHNYPARPERVREALVGLTELRLIEERTADPTQHERLGVDDPARPEGTAVGLRLLDAGGAKLAELVVGRRRVRTQGGLPESVFVRRPDEARSWLGEGRLIVDTDPNLWIERDIANLPLGRVLRATIRRLDAPELIAAVSDDRDLHIVAPAGAPPTDDAKVEEIGRAFEFLTQQDVVPESQVPGDALGEARFEYRGGLVVTAWPSRDRQSLWLRLRAETAPGAEPTIVEEAERLDARWRGWAYQVGAWKERALMPRLGEMLVGAAEPGAGPPPALR